MPRVSSKHKYTVQVFELFKDKGLLLNMEQIAQSLGLTKKTLYNNFSSKQELIATVLDYFYSELDKKIQASNQKSVNAIEAFFDVSVVISNEISKLGALLLKDLSLYPSCPDIFNFTDRQNYYSKLLRENLCRGISEGLYRNNLDMDYSALFYASAIELFYKWDGGFRFLENTSEYHRALVVHHLYSVVNDKGRALLENYL